MKRAIAALVIAGCSGSNTAGPSIPIEPAGLYAQNCANCHGADGKGALAVKMRMPVMDLTAPAFRMRASNEQIEQIIMAGRNQMPAFGGQLSMPKIQSLAGYVKRMGLP